MMTTASGAAFLNGDQIWRSSNYRPHEATHISHREVRECVYVHTHACVTLRSLQYL